MIKLGATKHPEQRAITKLRFIKVFDSIPLVSTVRIFGYLRLALNFCEAFLQIIVTRLFKLNSKEMNNHINFPECLSHSKASSTEAFCITLHFSTTARARIVKLDYSMH